MQTKPNFYIRCSQLSKVMTEPKAKHPLILLKDIDKKINDCEDTEQLVSLLREKGRLERLAKIPHLSVGAKTYLREVYTSIVYGREKEIESKYLRKGLNVEEDAITLLSLVDNRLYKKNTVRVFEDGLTGEIDIEDTYEEDHILDTKASWDIFTFFNKKDQELDDVYYWQAQGYMSLFNKSRATVAFCLVDTPDEILKIEEKKLSYKYQNDDPLLQEELESLKKRHKFSDIPMKSRVIKFKVDRCDSDIEKLKQRVQDCVTYLNFLYDEDFG